MSRIEIGSYGPNILQRLDQGSRAPGRRPSSEISVPHLPIPTLLNDQRGGHRLTAALGLAAVLLGGGAVAKVFMDNNG